MADLNRKMAEGHTVSDLDTVIDEVYGAHGDYDTLGDRLDDIDTIIDTAKLGIHYKGEVNYYSNLPTTGVSIGDAYTVKYAGSSGTTPDGTEYVWGTVSGTNQWINFSKDSYTKAEVDALLALKQNALSSTQLDAVNSGITSADIEQIETNKSNISTITPALKECVDNGKKQLLQFYSDTNGALVATAQSNGYSVIITGGDDNTGKTVSYAECTIEKTGNYTFSCDLSGTGASCYIYDVITGTQIKEYYATSSETLTLTGGHTYQLRTYRKGSGTNATVAAMICESALYAISSDMRPYAMSNAELTAKEQVNENNISLLTNGLYPTAYTKPTSATGIFLQSGGYCMIGNICVVCLRFSDSSAVAANTAIFSGLPLPVKDSTIGENRILIAVANNKNIELNVTSSGEIKLGGTALSGANDIITAFAVYLAQS